MRSPAFISCLLLSWNSAVSAGADGEGHAFEPHHHVTVTLGYAAERKRDKDEEAGAIGLDYAYRFTEQWGAGAFVEALGDDVVRDVSLGVLAGWHPAPGLFLVTGPGIEFAETKNEWLWRFGAGYDFHLQNGWTAGPRLTYDTIEGGKRTTILSLALGKEF